jgi:CHAT domain-containing protein
LVHLGKYEQALREYGQACAAYVEQEEDKLAVARLRTNMVAVLKNLGRYEEALELASVARENLQPWGQSRYLATLEMNVGSTCRLLGRYEEALIAYERGRAIFALLDNQIQAARMDVNRARALVCLDRFGEAEALLRAAGRIFAKAGQALPLARVDLNLATLLSRQGRHREALEFYTQACDAFETLGAKTDVAVSDLYRTYDYLALNLLPEALELAAEAEEALAQQGMARYVALAAGNRAVAARKMGRHAEALDALRSAREVFAERGAVVEVAQLDLERATCLREMGDPATAVAVATEAVEVLSDHNLHLQTAHARLTLADGLLALGETDRAVSLYLSARKVLKEIPSLAWRAHDGLGQAAEARGQREQAFQHYHEAIACIEAAQEELGIEEFQAGFLEDKLTVYQRAVRLALSLDDQEMAFDHAERSKTGVWRDFLTQEETESEAQAKLGALRREWHWLYNRLMGPDRDDEERVRGGEADEARWARLRVLERQVARARRESGRALQRRPGLSLADVQRYIPADTLLLDYYCTAKEVIVFLVDGATVQVFERLAPLPAVERAVNRWRFNAESVRLSILEGQLFSVAELIDEAQHALYDLYQLLVQPLEPQLAGYRSLWLVPHGLLWTIPLAALYDGRRYLMETFELTYLLGLIVSEKSREEVPLLAEAPVIVGCSEGGRLPHAVSEARAVATTLGRGELLLEKNATKERLRASASSCTLLHMATHGYFRADAPLFSSLHLADGWLTADEVQEWALSRAGLVTLSACESGMILSRGSDLLGLVRGFFRAGARRLVVSLWAVDDASTAELMVPFYGALGAGKGVASALREAQTAILEEYKHPFYWAGFEVMSLLEKRQQTRLGK